MAKGDLKLKRELAPIAVEPPSGEFTVASVWVDASVYHLDTPFSYLIPGNLASKVVIGSLVQVPFHGRELIGAVIALENPQSLTGLKSITKVLGSYPLLTVQIINLIKSAARRYAAHPFDLIRSAIPDRIASIEKDYLRPFYNVEHSGSKTVQQYLQLPPGRSRTELMAKKVETLLKEGSVLVVLPDSREVKSLHGALSLIEVESTVLDSQLTKSQYFSNFLDVRSGKSKVVIGTRSAIFAPVSNLASIVIYNEGSEHLYERRSPGWNSRDIALLRRQSENINLIFIGYSPSSEVARFIDEGWIEFKRSRSRLKVSTFSQSHGELLPSRALTQVKSSISAGPVLFLVPTKGYAQAIRCAKCRTISRCECGGAHVKTSAHSPISCSHCSLSVPQWQCRWCNHLIPSLQARGIDRHSHEIGLLLPGIATHISSADHPLLDGVSDGIVIATPGMAPFSRNGYSAVVILEGNRFLDQPDMRASERVREMYFSHAALAKSGAPIIVVQDDGHSIVTGLTSWNPSMAIHRDLEERASLALPPYVRAAMLTMESHEITRLKNALISARDEERLPQSTKILGPIPSADKASLILTVDVAQGDALVSTLHEFMRRRSASWKSLPILRIDPYSLSR